MKIKIMNCVWNKSLEGRQLEVEKITSKNPTIKELLYQIIKRLDNLEHRLDAIVEANHLIDPTKK